MTNVIHEAELREEISFVRGRDWYDPSQSDAHVTIVGCGGIGSPTALSLAKLGIPKITLIDGDTVEKHNIPNQMFPLNIQDDSSDDYFESSFGHPKVFVLAEFLETMGVSEIQALFGFLNTKGITHNDTFQAYKPSGIVVAGLDSMAARQEVWKTVRYNMNVDRYIDARLGGEIIMIYVVDPKDYESCKKYEETLHSDEEARELPCTRRIVIDVGFMVAGLITRTIRRYLAGDDVDSTLMFNQETLGVMRG